MSGDDSRAYEPRCSWRSDGMGMLAGSGDEVWIACPVCGWQSSVYRRRWTGILLGIPAWASHRPSPSADEATP